MNKGLIFAKSQSEGNEADERDCVKMAWRIGARMDEQGLIIKAGIRSGPMDLEVSSPSSNFFTPFVVMSRGGMLWKGLCGMLGVWSSSCVYTDWECALSICALCSEVVVRVLVLSFRDVIVLVSCLRVLKDFLLLFLTLCAR